MMKRRAIKITRERAIQIASNHNCVSMETAQNYTDSELREVLRRLARGYDCAAVYSLRPNLLTPAHHAVANRFTTEVYER